MLLNALRNRPKPKPYHTNRLPNGQLRLETQENCLIPEVERNISIINREQYTRIRELIRIITKIKKPEPKLVRPLLIVRRVNNLQNIPKHYQDKQIDP